MKSSKTPFYSLLLITVLVMINYTDLLVIERKLTAKNTETFFTEFLDDAQEALSPIVFEIVPDSTHSKTLLIEGKGDSKITVSKEGGTIQIHMKNDYEQFDISSENMDYTKQKGMIKANFLTPYINHLKEIVHDIDSAFDEVSKGFTGVTHTRDNGEEPFSFTSIEKVQPQPGATDIEFDIKISGAKMEDGIYGSLTKEGEKGYKLKLITKYFQNEFVLNVQTQNYLEQESKNMLLKMLSHLDNMITLNESEGKSTENKLDDEKIFASIEKTWETTSNKNDKFVGAKEGDDGFKITYDGNGLVDIKISQINADGFQFKNVQCTIITLENKVFSQNFLVDSLYEMSGILKAYLEDIRNFAVHSVNSENPEEFVPAFREGAPQERILQAIHKKIKFKNIY